MRGRLTLPELEQAVAAGSIDTVVVAQTDMQGRLMGKRFQAEYFLASGHRETHGCNYLLATDYEMETVPGFKATSWAAGYGDYVMRPDLATLRVTPWLEGTAIVLCDVLDHHGHDEVPHSPRAVLKRQIARLAGRGLAPMMASELEFFLFTEPFAEVHAAGHRGMTPVSAYNEDYHVFQTTKEEDVMRAIRTGLHGAGIPVESSKGEASPGQEEVNVSYADALAAADAHVVTKNAHQGDRLGQGQVRHLHGQVRRQRRRLLLPHPPVAPPRRRQRRLPRPRRAARHVGADAELPRRPHRPRRRRRRSSSPRTSTATSASSPAPSRRPRPSGRPTTAPPASASSARTRRPSASSAGSAAPTLTPTSPSRQRSPPASPASRRASSSAPSSPATPTPAPACPRSRRRSARPPRRSAARRCCAPPSATTSSTTTSTPPAGSSPPSTAASPTGSSRAASSGPERAAFAGVTP